MKMFIPKVGDLIRLTEDVTIKIAENDAGHRYRPHGSEVYPVVYGEAAYDYHKAAAIDSFTLIKGTVLKFKRIWISAHAKANDIEVSIFAHPDPILTPRAQGGKGKRAISMTLTSDQINEISYEQAHL